MTASSVFCCPNVIFLSGSMLLRSNASFRCSNASFLPLQNCRSLVYAEALTLARALRSSNRRCFLSRITLKRSKSVRPFLLWICSRFLAQLLSFHLASISFFCQSFLTAPFREPRMSPSTTNWERRHLARGTACRGTTSSGSAEGPSTRTCKSHFVNPPHLKI